jgi:hypothetical protein
MWGKKVAPPIETLLDMDDSAINKLLKQHKVSGIKSARELRKATKDGRRPLEGEKGFDALLAGLKGGGTGGKNYRNQPVTSRVHPAVARKQLAKEVQQAIRTGDRQRQQQLRDEAKKMGWI